MATPPPIDLTSPRIFLDASVIVSGIMSEKGGSHALLALSELGLIRSVVCPYLLKETERNIQNKAPKLISRYIQVKARINWEIIPDPTKQEVDRWLTLIPAKDAPVLAAAVNAAPLRLVTLDVEHFIRPSEVAKLSGLRICTPGELLREIRTVLAQGFKQEE